jgi:NTP pyrophosphatase (non-canonical NTP hydrolase)
MDMSDEIQTTTVAGLNEYQDLAGQTGNKRLTREMAMCNYAIGLGEECNEWGTAVVEMMPMLAAEMRNFQAHAAKLQGLVKKHVFHGHDADPDRKAADRANFVKEAGDVLWYLSQLSKQWGVSLEEIANTNIAKLAARYPQGFSKQASLARPEYQGEAA